eukprot:12820588-Ditylum_brightwellii.AAC.1
MSVDPDYWLQESRASPLWPTDTTGCTSASSCHPHQAFCSGAQEGNACLQIQPCPFAEKN